MFNKFLNIETGKTFIAGPSSQKHYEGNKLIKHLGACDENGRLLNSEGGFFEEKKADQKTLESLKKEMLAQNRVMEDEKGRPIETQDSYDFDDEK